MIKMYIFCMHSTSYSKQIVMKIEFSR